MGYRTLPGRRLRLLAAITRQRPGVPMIFCVSPRQWKQLVFFTVFALLFVALIAAGYDVALNSVLLAVLLCGAASLIRYYRRGGKPLDRGGEPFWRR